MAISRAHQLLGEILAANSGIGNRPTRKRVADEVSAIIGWIEKAGTLSDDSFERKATKLLEHFGKIVAANGGEGGDRHNPNWASAAACETILFAALCSKDSRQSLQLHSVITQISTSSIWGISAAGEIVRRRPWLAIATIFGIVWAIEPASNAISPLLITTQDECVLSRLADMQNEAAARLL